MHMGLSRCKLTAYQQKRLLEYFVLEVTARSAADMLQIHPNSAALFYTKVRLLITKQLALDAQQRFDGNIELDESYFGGVRKGKRGRGAAGIRPGKLSLSVRQWRCPDCGAEHDRDVNAAINLRNLAVSSTVSACGEEGADLGCKIQTKPASVKQEASSRLAQK